MTFSPVSQRPASAPAHLQANPPKQPTGQPVESRNVCQRMIDSVRNFPSSVRAGFSQIGFWMNRRVSAPEKKSTLEVQPEAAQAAEVQQTPSKMDIILAKMRAFLSRNTAKVVDVKEFEGPSEEVKALAKKVDDFTTILEQLINDKSDILVLVKDSQGTWSTKKKNSLKEKEERASFTDFLKEMQETLDEIQTNDLLIGRKLKRGVSKKLEELAKKGEDSEKLSDQQKAAKQSKETIDENLKKTEKAFIAEKKKLQKRLDQCARQLLNSKAEWEKIARDIERIQTRIGDIGTLEDLDPTKLNEAKNRFTALLFTGITLQALFQSEETQFPAYQEKGKIEDEQLKAFLKKPGAQAIVNTFGRCVFTVGGEKIDITEGTEAEKTYKKYEELLKKYKELNPSESSEVAERIVFQAMLGACVDAGPAEAFARLREDNVGTVPVKEKVPVAFTIGKDKISCQSFGRMERKREGTRPAFDYTFSYEVTPSSPQFSWDVTVKTEPVKEQAASL